jgi:small GTP-binding protein
MAEGVDEAKRKIMRVSKAEEALKEIEGMKPKKPEKKEREPGLEIEPELVEPKKKGGVFRRFRKRFSNIFGRIFRRRKSFRLGIYGPTNAGKTTLANRISIDWLGEEVGTVSAIPHETRHIQSKENIVIKSKAGKQLVMNLLDTPGIATKIDFEDFVKHGMKEKEAKKRAREATQGIIESIKWLDSMDVVLAVMDATEEPYNQVNLTILGNLEARGIPVIVVANKIDLKKANIKKIEVCFPQYKVVGISAKESKNIEDLYETIFEVVK